MDRLDSLSARKKGGGIGLLTGVVLLVAEHLYQPGQPDSQANMMLNPVISSTQMALPPRIQMRPHPPRLPLPIPA